MVYFLRKDSKNNWHFDYVNSGSWSEQLLCRRLAQRYLHVQLEANTPNCLVDTAIRHKYIPYTSKLLPGVISFLPDGHIKFLYGSH